MTGMHPRNPQRGRWLLAGFGLALAVCLVMIAAEFPKHYQRDGWLEIYRLTTPVELQWPTLRLTPDDADD